MALYLDGVEITSGPPGGGDLWINGRQVGTYDAAAASATAMSPQATAFLSAFQTAIEAPFSDEVNPPTTTANKIARTARWASGDWVPSEAQVQYVFTDQHMRIGDISNWYVLETGWKATMRTLNEGLAGIAARGGTVPVTDPPLTGRAGSDIRGSGFIEASYDPDPISLGAGVYAMTRFGAQETLLEPVGADQNHRVRFPISDGSTMDVGRDRTQASTPNKALVRVGYKLIVSTTRFSADGVTPNNAVFEAAGVKWLADLVSLHTKTHKHESFGSYDDVYESVYLALLAFLPSGHTARTSATALLNLHLERQAAIAVGGLTDAATFRDKRQMAMLLQALYGFWSPINGSADLTGALATEATAIATVRHLADYTPSATIALNLHHQGVTTYEGVWTRDMPATAPSGGDLTDGDATDRGDYRAFRYQRMHPTNRLAYGLSSISLMGSTFLGDPPRRTKLVIATPDRYARLWLTDEGAKNVANGTNFDRDHATTWGCYDHHNLWIAQHRNVVMIVTGDLQADARRLAGPWPTADAVDVSNARWALARFGDAFVAYWFARDYAIDAAVEDVSGIRYSPDSWPLGGTTVPRIVSNSGNDRHGAIMAVYHAAQWPGGWATFVAAMHDIEPSFTEAASPVLQAAMPVVGDPARPDEVAAVMLNLTRGARLTIGGTPQPACGVPTVTAW